MSTSITPLPARSIGVERIRFSYGNTTAATIPLLLEEAAREGRLKPGMKIAMVGFGSGFTWGSALIRW